MRRTLLAATAIAAALTAAPGAKADPLSPPESHVLHVEQQDGSIEAAQSRIRDLAAGRGAQIEAIRLMRTEAGVDASITVTIERSMLQAMVDEISKAGGSIIGRESRFGSLSFEIETRERQIDPLVVAIDRIRQIANQGSPAERAAAERELAQAEGRLEALRSEIASLSLRQALVSVEVRTRVPAQPEPIPAATRPAVEPLHASATSAVLTAEMRAGAASLVRSAAFALPWLGAAAPLLGFAALARAIARRGRRRATAPASDPLTPTFDPAPAA